MLRATGLLGGVQPPAWGGKDREVLGEGHPGDKGRGWGTSYGHWGHWDVLGQPEVGTGDSQMLMGLIGGALKTGWAVGAQWGSQRAPHQSVGCPTGRWTGRGLPHGPRG